MLERLAKWYIMRKCKKLNNIEIVINGDGCRLQTRNREKEESIKETLCMIK